MAARPLEQVLEEVEQAAVGPLHVLEDEHGRRSSASRSKKSRHAEKRFSWSPGAPLLEPEQVREPRLDPGALLRVGDVLLERRRAACRERAAGSSSSTMSRACAPSPRAPSTRRLRRRRGSGRGARTIVGEPVDVLLELPGEARLADPGDAGDRDELRLALLRRRVEELLDEPQLAVAADERRLEPDRLERAAAARGRRAAPARAAPAPPCPSARARRPPRRRSLPRSRVASPRRRGPCPGSAADWMRDAVLTRSPATMPWPSAPSVTAASPVRTPARARSPGRRPRRRATARRRARSSAARTARSASSSFAIGVPQTAMTASPMNFSTVPP